MVILRNQQCKGPGSSKDFLSFKSFLYSFTATTIFNILNFETTNILQIIRKTHNLSCERPLFLSVPCLVLLILRVIKYMSKIILLPNPVRIDKKAFYSCTYKSITICNMSLYNISMILPILTPMVIVILLTFTPMVIMKIMIFIPMVTVKTPTFIPMVIFDSHNIDDYSENLHHQ